jgi:kinesin family protein 3/17
MPTTPTTKTSALLLPLVLLQPIEPKQVVVRCRPMSATEVAQGCTSVVEMDADAGQVTLLPAGRPGAGAGARGGGGAGGGGAAPAAGLAGDLRTFTFDQVYDESSTQAEIFQVTAAPIVDSVMEGFNGA